MLLFSFVAVINNSSQPRCFRRSRSPTLRWLLPIPTAVLGWYMSWLKFFLSLNFFVNHNMDSKKLCPLVQIKKLLSSVAWISCCATSESCRWLSCFGTQIWQQTFCLLSTMVHYKDSWTPNSLAWWQETRTNLCKMLKSSFIMSLRLWGLFYQLTYSTSEISWKNLFGGKRLPWVMCAEDNPYFALVIVCSPSWKEKE